MVDVDVFVPAVVLGALVERLGYRQSHQTHGVRLRDALAEVVLREGAVYRSQL